MSYVQKFNEFVKMNEGLFSKKHGGFGDDAPFLKGSVAWKQIEDFSEKELKMKKEDIEIINDNEPFMIVRFKYSGNKMLNLLMKMDWKYNLIELFGCNTDNSINFTPITYYPYMDWYEFSKEDGWRKFVLTDKLKPINIYKIKSNQTVLVE